MGERRFVVELIKPSHYDDDGYVIQWLRSAIPSNSLASVYGLLAECADDRVLGPDVDIEVEPHDEMNTVINVDRIVRGIRAAGGGFVGLVGVQSNQFPRALDLGRRFRTAGIPVVMGGFHVSGCLSMLRELPPDLREALVLASAQRAPDQSPLGHRRSPLSPRAAGVFRDGGVTGYTLAARGSPERGEWGSDASSSS